MRIVRQVKTRISDATYENQVSFLGNNEMKCWISTFLIVIDQKDLGNYHFDYCLHILKIPVAMG